MAEKRQNQVHWMGVTLALGVLCLGPALSRADEPEQAAEEPVLQIDPNAAPEQIQAQIEAYMEAQRKAIEQMLASDPEWQPAFQETHVIRVGQESGPVRVNNFCLDRNGNVLVCCGGAGGRVVKQEDGQLTWISDPGGIRVFSPEGRHQTTWSLEFAPQAIAAHRDGTVFVGGEGRLARLDYRGRVIIAADLPELPAEEPLRVPAEEESVEDESAAQEESQAVQESDEPAEEEEEVQERSERDVEEVAKTETEPGGFSSLVAAIVDLFTEDEQPPSIDPRAREITGMAVTDEDLFVARRSKTGYAVWRMRHDFSDPVEIVDRLRGCCGQMDIGAYDGHLYVAENSRKHVACFDRDGNLVDTFGSGDRKRASGFGSCCNPMNLCFSPTGEVITSESGPPDAVKRFTRDGEFLGVLALPKLEGGCVRVQVAMSPGGDHVFVLNTRSGEIHVFADPRYVPTHEQVATIAIPLGDQTAAIHSFCVDSRGNLLAACGGERTVYTQGPSGSEIQTVNEPSGIHVISPDGKLLESWSLEITPQVVNVAPDGSVYCGGQGRLAKLSPDGKILLVADAPQVAELPPLEPLDAEQEEAAEEDEETKRAKEEEKKAKIEALNERMAAVRKEVDETYQQANAEKDEQAKAQAEAELEKALLEYYRVREQIQELTVDAKVLAMQRRSAALRKRAITGIAVAEEDVFVACPATEGFGYDVWRLDRELANPQKIVSRLRGCCGQMDVQASGDRLYAAENSRKRVVCYDRDGNQLAAWGSADRTSVEGFGSCCNPMNIRFGPDGEVYTSEASVGRIKRFSPEGEFLGLVGTVTIVPGCKHVPIGVSQDGGRVYMLDITRTHIVVMEPRDASGKQATAAEAVEKVSQLR